MTGPNGPNKTLDRFGISGTDLGILWDNGDPVNRQVLMAFGDTFGYCRLRGQQWRYNVLFRSQDRNLSDGITVPAGVPNDRYSGSPMQQPNFSKQVLPGIKWASQEGMIPTAGIAIGRTQYMNFMSIKQWAATANGRRTTQRSRCRRTTARTGDLSGTVRASSPDSVPGARYVPGNENFQMGAFMRGKDGYIYSFGTPSGRGGPAFLARVPPNFVPDVTKYQYWNGDHNAWVPNNPGAATPVFPALWVKCRPNTTTTSSNTWCSTPTEAATTSWQGPRLPRKGHGAPSKCSYRRSRCLAASMRPCCIPGRR
ncbi:hypothetical protein I552_3315 [Mycobacterium xenopi 3993]|nr:hypothetical protein I552_3315 [Mycobacterium xenopi 3993]